MPSEIGNVTALKHLHLDNDNVNGTITSESWNLKSLIDLSLNDNHTQGNVSLSFCSLSNLRRTLNDVWLCPGLKADSATYCQHAVLCTDDLLVAMEEPKKFVQEEIGERFNAKEKSISPPSQCLGNKVALAELESDA